MSLAPRRPEYQVSWERRPPRRAEPRCRSRRGLKAGGSAPGRRVYGGDARGRRVPAAGVGRSARPATSPRSVGARAGRGRTGVRGSGRRAPRRGARVLPAVAGGSAPAPSPAARPLPAEKAEAETPRAGSHGRTPPRRRPGEGAVCGRRLRAGLDGAQPASFQGATPVLEAWGGRKWGGGAKPGSLRWRKPRPARSVV